ncbi:aminopeptidase P family protein [Roseomonas sp. OT10]|uniref:aminopeptidase P family protein n=1 Tax=Roseomonas cutis TaxID=2897332 RepID=UPI001E4223E1|nr:aminopeptidase P family protein [Roseomonas sp. OT10]UFN51336.1 aminopeptidase P family protein [Roseomonas sp. OT10]
MNPVDALRARLAGVGVEGFLVPRADEYLGEYVPPSAERLAWLTGFTGSAGLAIVLPERAALFIDGRYTTQAEQQADPALWERRHLTEQPPQDWLKEHAAGRRVGYDPRLHSQSAIDRLAASGAVLVPLEANPLDAAWGAMRPAPPTAPAVPHRAEHAGQDSAAKRAEAAAALREAGQDAAVLADAHSVAWLLNLRGGDLENTPLALSAALLHADGAVDLFIDPVKVTPELRAHLGNAVALQPLERLPSALDALGGKVVRVDPDVTPAWYGMRLREAGATVTAGDDPVRLPRARKNAVEQGGSRAAHARDALALARFLAWLAAEAPEGGLTETGVAKRLLALRAELPLFRGESFPAIVGSGPNGAIVHYRATPAGDRRIGAGECVLIDSGAQFLDGTTDVTRTVWTGPGPAPAELRERYTRVLRGHVALATLRFPKGVAGPHLDAIARRPLWDAGLDYDHGTGHGVGSFLSVHEGPVAFSRAAKPVPLEEGMVLSDEPGFYLPGHYGIRIENLLLVRAAGPGLSGRPWLSFETLTLTPYERRLIQPALLTAVERDWVDTYHARVLEEVGPRLDAATAAWLAAACAPLEDDPA